MEQTQSVVTNQKWEGSGIMNEILVLIPFWLWLSIGIALILYPFEEKEAKPKEKSERKWVKRKAGDFQQEATKHTIS